MNQDAFGLYNHFQFWVVADGMGGHAGGEVASRIAVETTSAFIEKHLTTQLNKSIPLDHYGSILCEALKSGNQAIRVHARQHPEYTGMGTTALILHISDDANNRGTIVHAGDSRAYLIQDQSCRLLTRDHSMVEDEIELGIITPEQALTHPLRHMLTQALGIEHDISPSVTIVDLNPRDRLLLCTDGLTKMMTDKEITDTIANKTLSLEETCDALIKEANQLGGKDNVTVVMIGVEEDS